jgi:hypothetical protein
MQGKGAAFGFVQHKDSSDEEQKEPNRLDEIFKPNKKVYVEQSAVVKNPLAAVTKENTITKMFRASE